MGTFNLHLGNRGIQRTTPLSSATPEAEASRYLRANSTRLNDLATQKEAWSEVAKHGTLENPYAISFKDGSRLAIDIAAGEVRASVPKSLQHEHAHNLVDIGSNAPEKPLVAKVTELSTDVGMVSAGAAFAVGIAAMSAGNPVVATVAFNTAAIVAKGAAIASIGGHVILASQATIKSGTKLIHETGERFAALLQANSHEERMVVVKKTILDASISAKAFAKNLWESKFQIALVAAQISVFTIGASYLSDIAEKADLSRVAEGSRALAESAKNLIESFAFLLHPHLPTAVAGLYTAAHGSVAVSEINEIREHGKMLGEARKAFVEDLGAILAKESPQSRHYALAEIEDRWAEDYIAKRVTYAGEYVEVLREVARTGEMPSIDGVTKGFDSHYFGHASHLKKSIKEHTPGISITDASQKSRSPGM